MMSPKRSLRSFWFRAVHTFYFTRNTLLEIAKRASWYPRCLVAENHEIWGIFSKDKSFEFQDSPRDKATTAHAHEVLRLIHDYQKNRRIRDAIEAPLHRLSAMRRRPRVVGRRPA